MNRTVIDLLEQLKHVGGARQKGNKSDAVFDDLHPLLKDDEWWELRTARSHYLSGEGREELDRVCNQLIQKYRHDPPERKFTLL